MTVITFTSSGYIEVWKDGAVVSRHRAEREAIESCARTGPGSYTLTYPPVTVKVTSDATAVIGIINGALQA